MILYKEDSDERALIEKIVDCAMQYYKIIKSNEENKYLKLYKKNSSSKIEF